MGFSSFAFLFFFLPVFVPAYLLAPRAGRNIVLLTFSIVFYTWITPTGTALLLVTTAIDYYLGGRIAGAETAGRKKLFLAFAVGVNLAALFYFKYWNFFAGEAARALAHFGAVGPTFEKVAFPVGVSFFVFHKISYVVDIYRGEARPARSLADFATYTFMFPKLMQGPIVRWKTIAEQVAGRAAGGLDGLFRGACRFARGLAMKVLIADQLGSAADAVFSLGLEKTTPAFAWLGALCYTFQIYFDFAGYSDMAIGLGLMLGFTIDENFNRPYLAGNFSEFWRRWHMTLSVWFRNYLYIPLGGNRVSAPRMYLNLWAVFLLSGLWHGANWTFIVWGAYHGLFLVLDKAGWTEASRRLGRAVTVPLTFFFVTLGWVVFRSPDLGFAAGYLGRMFLLTRDSEGLLVLLPELISNRGLAVLGLAAFLSFVPEGIVAGARLRLGGMVGEGASTLARAGVAVFLAALSFSVLTNSAFMPFIYLRF